MPREGGGHTEKTPGSSQPRPCRPQAQNTAFLLLADPPGETQCSKAGGHSLRGALSGTVWHGLDTQVLAAWMTNNALKNLESLGDGLGPLSPRQHLHGGQHAARCALPSPCQLLNADGNLGGACCAPHLTDEETEAEQSHSPTQARSRQVTIRMPVCAPHHTGPTCSKRAAATAS